MVIALCLLVASDAALAQTPPTSPNAAAQSLQVYATLTLQYVGALTSANSLSEEVFKALSQSGDRTLPGSLWAEIGLGPRPATLADLYASIYRSQMVPALTEIRIGLARLVSSPELDQARIDGVKIFLSRLAEALEGLNGESISQSGYVSRVNALFAEGLPLLGARVSLAVAPNRGAITEVAVGAARTPTASPYAAGYAVALSGTAPGAPIRASFIAPSVGCTATGPVRALQVGVTLSGPLAGTGVPAVTLTISCDGPHADYTSSPALGPGQQIRPGDRLMMTLTPGAAGSTESLADVTRHFRLLAHASGIAVRSIEFGIQPLSSLSIGVSPGTAKNSPSVGPTTIGAVKYDALPSFRPLMFQSCSIGGGPLASHHPSPTYLTASTGAPEATPGPLVGTSFTLSSEK